MKRRAFLSLCTTAAAFVAARPAALAAKGDDLQPASRARLVDPRGRPLRPQDLEVGRSYVFHYPYRTTPCFLVDLGRRAAAIRDMRKEDGSHYRWRGGVGPGASVVAFSAICAHRMSYPTRKVSFIRYYHRRRDRHRDERAAVDRDGVIHCCSEGSVYDPADGARVLAGPAPQPLAAVDLEFDAEEGSFTARGVYGGEMFERFFADFEFQLVLEHGTEDIRRPVAGSTTVWLLEAYTANREVC